MGSLQGAMTNMRDLTSQVTALGRQRKMTGNMSFGENFEPAIYKGLYESALGKMVDFGNLDVNQQNAATNRYNADTNRFEADTGRMAAGWTHDYQMGSLSNEATRNSIYGQEVSNTASYQQGQLGLGYANLDATKAWQQGQLGIQQQQADIDALWKAGQLTNQERELALKELQTKAQIALGKDQNKLGQQGAYMALGGTALNALGQVGAAYMSQPKTTKITATNVESVDFNWGLEDGSDDMELESFNPDLSTETWDNPTIENQGDGWDY